MQNYSSQKRAHHLAIYTPGTERQTEESRPMYMEIANWKTKDELDKLNEDKAKKFSWFNPSKDELFHPVS